MNKRIKKRWLEALRSRKYKQTQETLKKEEKSKVSFCCLGVLTDLYIKSKAGKESNCSWANSGELDGWCSFVCDDNKSPTDLLPSLVIEWAELDSSDPELATQTCSEANDEGKTFCQIAKLIEKHL
jgi:hypothetical protein